MLQNADDSDKSWFQRQKDKLSDHKEKRAQRKAEERKQRIEQERQIRVGLVVGDVDCELTITETGRGI